MQPWSGTHCEWGAEGEPNITAAKKLVQLLEKRPRPGRLKQSPFFCLGSSRTQLRLTAFIIIGKAFCQFPVFYSWVFFLKKLTGKDLTDHTMALFSGTHLTLPTVVLNFGESASFGTGMWISTLLAVDLRLNWLLAWEDWKPDKCQKWFCPKCENIGVFFKIKKSY